MTSKREVKRFAKRAARVNLANAARLAASMCDVILEKPERHEHEWLMAREKAAEFRALAAKLERPR